MTLTEIRNMVLFQTNNDATDLADYQPAIDIYINEGYDKLVKAYADIHLDDIPAGQNEAAYTKLESTTDECLLPEWTQMAIVNYATYLMYRNGNAPKQNRGIPYYQMFLDVLNKLPYENGRVRKLYNLYVEQ